jgi:hypothetical protein
MKHLLPEGVLGDAVQRGVYLGNELSSQAGPL